MRTDKYENRFFQVDAFTDTAFRGNPTGVCILKKPADGNFLNLLASEFGLNQTAFLIKQGDSYNIRFFTKFAEVALCAHAAIASAHVLHVIGESTTSESVMFKTAKHEILVTMENGFYKVLFPEYQVSKIEVDNDFIEITGLRPTELYKCSHEWYLAYFKDHEDIRRALPHFVKMKHSEYGHLVITAQGNKSEGDYIQRSFTPNHGVNEEDVSASAQCALTPFWKSKLNITEFTSIQASHRGGLVKTRTTETKMIEIMGKATIIMEGVF